MSAGPGRQRIAATVGALGGLVTAGPVAVVGLAPEAGAALGTSPVAVRLGVLVWGIGAALGALVATRIPSARVRSSLAPSAAAVGLGFLVAAGSGRTATLHLALLLAGAAAGPIAVGGRSLVAGTTDDPTLTTHDAAALGALAGALVGAALARSAFDLTWRGSLMVPALGMLVGAVPAAFVLSRGESSAEVGEDPVTGALGLSLAESMRRTTTVRAVRPILGAAAAMGALGLPLVDALHHLLGRRWLTDVGQQQRLLGVFALAACAGVVTLGHRRGSTVGRALRSASDLGFVAGACLAIGAGLDLYVPALVVMAAAGAALCAARCELDRVLLGLVPPAVRREALALTVAASVGGSALGFAVTQVIADRSSWTWSFALLGLAAALAAGSISRSAPAAEADERNRAEEAAADAAGARGSRPTDELLRCSGIDFSYGQVQVLFGVDLTVRQGETVALLGTNGAGKSTLLRVISGICTPQAGSVRLAGDDITFLDATRRVPMGISQVPGGKAVFGPLSVAENLRLYGYSLGADRRRVESGIDAAFDAFPRLAERRDQRASTLSGGEQQMLALSKAIILSPRLLLIDELSLGLAPKVVGELLVIVRRIAAEGTAVVLVEQSVNVALGLVEHAYFMEKGQIRFDGRAADLLERPDLLRSVFLAGAAKGLAS